MHTLTLALALASQVGGPVSTSSGVTQSELAAYIDSAVAFAQKKAVARPYEEVLFDLKRQGYVIEEVFYGKDERFNGMAMWLKGEYNLVLYAAFDGVNKPAADKIGRKLLYTTGWKVGKNRLGPAQTNVLEAAQKEFKLTKIAVSVPHTYQGVPSREAAVAFGSFVLSKLEAKFGKPTAKQFVWKTDGRTVVDGWTASWAKPAVALTDLRPDDDCSDIWLPATPAAKPTTKTK